MTRFPSLVLIGPDGLVKKVVYASLSSHRVTALARIIGLVLAVPDEPTAGSP